MKKILSIAAVFVLILCLCGCEEESNFPKATEQFYVNDFADVISEADEGQMMSNAVALANSTTAQVVVVTVEDLNGLEPYEYALEIGRLWGVGDKEKDNGVVILLSENDREIFVSVGYGLEGALPDSKTGRIIDLYGMEYLRADNFSKGILEISKAVVGEIYIEYGLEAPEGYDSINNIGYAESEDVGDVITSWIVMLVIIIVLSFIFRGRGGLFLFAPSFRGNYRGGGSGFGGGGFGGFRGGGGSFGGGGAGRGF